MKTLALGFFFLAITATCLVRGSEHHFWTVPSPDHEQTFAYGTEQDRTWTERGLDHHLALQLRFTNDPFVDRLHPRQYDNFIFSFPVVLGRDGRTYIYRAGNDRLVPVAIRFADFFGITEVRLLPNAEVFVDMHHGLLSLRLVVEDAPATASN